MAQRTRREGYFTEQIGTPEQTASKLLIAQNVAKLILIIDEAYKLGSVEKQISLRKRADDIFFDISELLDTLPSEYIRHISSVIPVLAWSVGVSSDPTYQATLKKTFGKMEKVNMLGKINYEIPALRFLELASLYNMTKGDVNSIPECCGQIDILHDKFADITTELVGMPAVGRYILGLEGGEMLVDRDADFYAEICQKGIITVDDLACAIIFPLFPTSD